MSWAIRFQLRQHVRQSLWLVPLLGTVVGAAAAQLDLWLEGRVSMPPGWTYPASTATGLLSAVAGAMIGLLGLVVTIGVLVVQMATGTLSPRFMRLWYRDRLQKLVLGRSPRPSLSRSRCCGRSAPGRCPTSASRWPGWR